MAKKVATSARSYTLRLAAPSESDNWLPLWQRLFQAHYSVCKGAEVFGQFYLNLRGGLGASLAACSDEQDNDRRRILQRGARRMMRANRKKGFFVSFDYSHDALTECDRFFRQSGRVIIPLTVKEILEQRISHKLA